MADSIWNGEEQRPTAASPYVPCPAPESPRIVRILYPRAGDKIHSVALGQRVLGLMMHWGDGKSVLCTAPWGPCHFCKQGLARRWEGFLSVCLWPNPNHCVLRITESAYRNSPSLLAEDGHLRGCIITASRLREVRNGPLKVEVRRPDKIGELPADRGVGEGLCRLWGYGLNSPVGKALRNPPPPEITSSPS